MLLYSFITFFLTDCDISQLDFVHWSRVFIASLDDVHFFRAVFYTKTQPDFTELIK